MSRHNRVMAHYFAPVGNRIFGGMEWLYQAGQGIIKREHQITLFGRSYGSISRPKTFTEVQPSNS